jgi:hypothetical protein
MVDSEIELSYNLDIQSVSVLFFKLNLNGVFQND